MVEFAKKYLYLATPLVLVFIATCFAFQFSDNVVEFFTGRKIGWISHHDTFATSLEDLADITGKLFSESKILTFMLLAMAALMSGRMAELELGTKTLAKLTLVTLIICWSYQYMVGGYVMSALTAFAALCITILVCGDHPNGKVPLNGLLIMGFYSLNTIGFHTFPSTLIGLAVATGFIVWRWNRFKFEWKGFCLKSPVTMAFAFICLLYITAFSFLGNDMFTIEKPFTREQIDLKIWFVSPTMESWTGDAMHYVRLFSHALGHADWQHFNGNMLLFLIVAPEVEKHFGWKVTLFMILSSAFMTGFGNMILFDGRIIGASGIVFTMIAMSAFIDKNWEKAPIGGLILIGMYLGKEIVYSFHDDGTSQFAHIAGGIIGILWAMWPQNHPLNPNRWSLKSLVKKQA